MEQRRLLLAFLLSAIILFGWSYLFPPDTPKPNANVNAPQSSPEGSSTPPQTVQQPAPESPNQIAETTPDSVPRRTVTVSTPLYKIEFDTQGAVAKSWIIQRNKDEKGEGKPLTSIASTKDNPKPLELVSPEGLTRGQLPLRLVTGKADVDSLLTTKNYRIGGVEGDVPAPQLEVRRGEQKSVEFSFTDPSSGLEALKKFSFDAERYVVKVETKVTQGGQTVPNVKMVVGPSIGDQGVPYYTFYSVAPEGVAFVGDSSQRFHASEIDGDKERPHVRAVDGPVHWAAVGDTYFSMALILPQPATGLEYRTEKYEHKAGETKEERFLISGYVPVPADGSAAFLYTGPKDHDQLEATSLSISQNLGGRPVDLGSLIDYGWTGPLTKPLAAPILWSIKHLNRLTGSYGVAIILFTIIIYMLFFPLKWRSSKAMKKAQKLAPKMKEIQEKIKGLKQNDPKLKELQMEQLRLMKEGNPLGGCLPLLIQMPFLIALYIAITISIDFRQSSFLWIQDLSAGDPTHLLPILMAASMLVLQLITPAPSADPLQRKMMAIIMPVMMLYILWSAPAGLLVYWLVGNLVGFGQQMVINRLLKSEDDEEPQPPVKGKAGAPPKNKLGEARVSQA
jgi:YidC/Oxa1 family membrane protein insertase